MKLSEAFPSKLLKAEDIKGRPDVTVKIKDYEMVKFDNDLRPVLHFVGKEKGLALNKTNANRIADVYGDEMDDWSGLPIILFVERVMFKTSMVDAIRVRIPDDARKAAQGRMAEPPPADEPPDYTDDDIPF